MPRAGSKVPGGRIRPAGRQLPIPAVDHGILIERLSRTYGISSAVLEWICSYLSDRSQVVLFDGKRSSVHRLHCGVPQGSVLGPLLFLLYTADLGELASQLGLSSYFYADDTQLYTTCL